MGGRDHSFECDVCHMYRGGFNNLQCECDSRPTDQAARDALERSIVERLPACSLDELRVLNVVLERLTKGRDDYGPLMIANDPRSFKSEAAEELTDCLFYLAAHFVAAERQHDEHETAPRQRIDFDTGGEA